MTTSKHTRRCFKAAKRIAKAHGLKAEFILNCRGHHKIRITGRGANRLTPVSSSPRSEDDSFKMKCCDVTRICREICSSG